MTTQTKMYDLTEMLNLYETTVQSTFQIHGTRKDALRLARQAIQQQYPDIKKTNLGSNILVARFWKQTQTIIRKYYPKHLPQQSPSTVPTASSVRAQSGVPTAVRPTPDASSVRAHGVRPIDSTAPTTIASDVSIANTFERRFFTWIEQVDFVPNQSCLMHFIPGLNRLIIADVFRSARDQGYEFQSMAFGYTVTKRPEPINTQVDEIKAQFTALISRLEKLTANSNQ